MADNTTDDDAPAATETGISSGRELASNYSSFESVMNSVATDLCTLERNLSSNIVQAGVAAFQSIGSQIGNIRRRLQHLAQNRATDATHQDLSQRLEQAELAHSNGIPLGILQQERERRSQQQQEGSDGRVDRGNPRNDSSSSIADGKTAATSSHDDSSSADAMDISQRKSQAQKDEEAEIGREAEEKAGRKRSSELLVSRRRNEELQNMESDLSMHEGGFDLGLSAVTESREERESNASSYADEQWCESDEGMDVDADGRVSEHGDFMDDEAIPTIPVPVLITDKSRHGLEMLRNTSVSGSLRVESIGSIHDSMDAEAPAASSVLYSWGTGDNSLHDDNLPKTEPTLVDTRMARYTIVSVAVGPKHTAAATASGEILASGSNESGQVAPFRRNDKVIFKPTLVESLCMTSILQVSCGLDHTAALSSAGTVVTWGNNSVGQLGHRQVKQKEGGGSLTHQTPAAMVLGAGRRAAGVACGDQFTLVLTSRMQVLACGTEDIVPWDSDGNPRLPSTLPALEGLPISSIAAGSRHAVAVTSHGTAFTWGVNDSGNCGRDFPKSLSIPVPMQVPITKETIPAGPSPFQNWASWDGIEEPVSMSQDTAVVHAACGAHHTVLVTRHGGLLVCGKNSDGQLGLEPQSSDVVHVQAVKHPNPTNRFVSAEAGHAHTLVLDDAGNVYLAGNGKPLHLVLKGKEVVAIAAGGGHSIAVTSGPQGTACRRQFSMDFDNSDSGVQLASTVDALVERISLGEDCQVLQARTEELFRYPAVVNSLFLNPADCDQLYQKLLSIPAGDVRQKIASSIENGMRRGLESLRSGDARLIYPETVLCLLMYLQCPLFCTWKENGLKFDYRGDLIVSLCETLVNLPFEGYRAVISWATSLYPKDEFIRFLVNPLLSQLERGLADSVGARSRAIPVVVMVLRWLHKSSERAGKIVPPEAFYSDAISQIPPPALFEDLRRFKASNKAQRDASFFLCAYPFLMSPTCKRGLLQIEHQIEMYEAARGGLTWDPQNRNFVFEPYFVLAVDREHLLQQTLQKISQTSPADLRKSIKVVFKGEDGVDAGGVTKEFFQLLSAELFDFNTGMWSSQVEDNAVWFNSDCTWNDEGYYLVGVLFGLALYNDVLLDVHFPSVVYRKLLGLPLGLEDIVDESTKSGLQHLLDYPGDDVEDVFCLNFQVSWMDLGTERRKDLKPGGAGIPVTSSNKEEYAVRYVKWLLAESVERQYEHFERGVMQVLDSSSLDLLRPEELESLVVGTPDLDFLALEKNTDYEGGFSSDSPVVKNFWRFADNADSDTQMKLLKFATGSPRAPIGGLGAMPFKIQRAGTDSMQLPTAHTCFNTLILPDYGNDSEKLERLLGRAIQECEGFGLQ